jgi:hypothetical protein
MAASTAPGVVECSDLDRGRACGNPNAPHVSPHRRFLALPSVGLQAAYLLTNSATIGDLLFLIYALFYLFTISHVLRYVLAPGEVTTDKIHGAIAAYILIGLLWASIYVFLTKVQPGSFSSGAAGEATKQLPPEDLIYFSFATLTTTGYGDIAPATAHARSLAILEQLAGTFYFVILIARLTGLYQGRRGRDSARERRLVESR